MQPTVFIDGAAGTTGLEIAARLGAHDGFAPFTLEEAQRKDPAARAEALNSADFAVLCLPDEAAREAMTLIEVTSNVRVIDASSAHRTTSGWIYGFPELVGDKVVAGAKRLSNPGCYATGFLALVAPLVRAGMLPAKWPYTVHAVSGYSGGGKGLIERFEADPEIAWRGYAMGLAHKHLREMQAKAGLAHPPVFSPAVIPTFRGMVVEVPLPLEAMPAAASPANMRSELARFYQDSLVVTLAEDHPDELVLRRDMMPTDSMVLSVRADPNGTQARLLASFDNLGKGASGAVIQSLNLMAGYEPVTGLRL